MANNLRKFATEAEYSAATLNYPSVSWVTSTDAVHFDKTAPTPTTFSGLTVTYNITSISSPTTLFYAASGSGSGSGSGGGSVPSSMIIDGTEVEVTKTYQFSTTGEHIVNYSFADNQIPTKFLTSAASETVRKAEIGDAITRINDNAFNNCLNITAVTLGNSLTYIGNDAFNSCSGLQSIVSNAMTAPELGVNVFHGINYNGVLTVPSGSQNYCNWISSGYLSGNWTIEGVTCGGSGSGSGS